MGVRARVLAVAGAVLLLTLGVWTLLFWRVFDAALVGSAQGHARVEAQQVAATLELVPPTSAVPVRDLPDGNDVLVQVVDAQGEVVAGSREDALGEPFTAERPGVGSSVMTQVDGLPGIDSDAYVVVTRGATGTAGEPLTVVVASPVHIEEGVESRIFLFGGLAATLVLGVAVVLVRWSVGASLLPVERLRGQLAEIDGHTFGDRVDVPGSGDELTRLAETMNEMLGRLEGAYAAQAGFVSDASHELRSPLSTLRTSVELAAADPTGRIWAETRPVVMAEILRLQRLVDDLLTLTKYDAGAVPLRRRECDLDDLVVEAVRRARDEEGPAMSVTPEPVRVLGDPDRLGQVLRNLLDNAVRHAGSAVRVELTADGTQAVVRVDNDGPPVPPEDRLRVFDRFVRLDATRDRDTGGAGLGLAIAADIARAHGGSVTAGEADDGWCRFELRLPRE